jgi:DNA invertase Pin-like site-specific DNA recombinase
VAGVYARKSNDQTGVSDEDKSVRRQEDHARAYAVVNGWTVGDAYVYADDGISGAEFERRPGLMRLLADAGQKPRPPFDVLIISEKSRLGRESTETGYILKKILRAGVRVFSYLDQREITIESAMDKVVESVLSAADELEREKASQRTHDALVRKARAGHVAGGRVFGYANVPVTGADGKRQHVARQVKEVEAAVVRQIFEWCAGGLGYRKIAYRLNEAGAVCPMPRQGRPRAWSITTVRDILHRRLYRGEVTWNKTAKRDAWGQKAPHDRPAAEWVVVTRPELQIVPEDLWAAAHARLERTHGAYLRATRGQRWGRPAGGLAGRYTLSKLAACGVCGGSLYVRTNQHGRRRVSFYHCVANVTRGRTVCENGHPMPMTAADRAVLTTVEAEVLRPEVIEAAVQEALSRLRPARDTVARRRAEGQATLARLEAECGQLTEAIAAGGEWPSLLAGLKARERERRQVEQELAGLAQLEQVSQLDWQQVGRDLRDRLTDWQGLLQRQPAQAQQILRTLLVGRLVFTPKCDVNGDFFWEFAGEGRLDPLLVGVVSAAPKPGGSPWSHQPNFVELFSSGFEEHSDVPQT